MTIYNWLLIACWAVFVIYWAVSAFSIKRTAKSNFLQGFIVRVVLAALAVVLVAAFHHGTLPPIGIGSAVPPALGIPSVTLAALGIAFAVWARYVLGSNWGMPGDIKSDADLVTSGPYAYVRHPIYTGVLLAILGSVLIGGWPWLVVFIAACGYFIYSAYQEEKVMAATFPEQYPAYRLRTKMLVPFVF
jgi:protein-S-isoprenylcysteine O-methyltransferase Ste14